VSIGAGDMNMRILTAFFIASLALLFMSVQADPIPVANYSFEFPVTEYAIPVVSLWRDIDLDTEYSSFTGTFKNTPAGSDDHVWNADGDQLGLLNDLAGNALEQEFAAIYEVGKSYQLTVGVCTSKNATPPAGTSLELAFYYISNGQFFDIAIAPVSIEGLTSTFLEDFSLILETVEAGKPWAGKNIGIAIRSTGSSGGYWDLDNVRLVELPLSPDLNGDVFVNLEDYAEVASQWLSCSQVTADLTGEGCVDDGDLLILLEYWLDNV
jgi:hypothetical protein